MTVRALAFATSNDEGLRLCNLLSLIPNNSFKPNLNFHVSLPNHRGGTVCLVTKPFLTFGSCCHRQIFDVSPP